MKKTEILFQYQLTDEYIVQQVLPLPNSKCVVLCWKYPYSLKLEVISFEQNEFIVSSLAMLEYRTSQYFFFRTSSCFGLMIETKEIRLWHDLNAQPEIIKIGNPFRADKFGRKYNVNMATVGESDNTFYFGLEQRESQGFPARYWAKLTIENSTMLGISLGKKARWSREKELELKNFPKTEFAFSETEFLSINNLMSKSGVLYVHTVGGQTTRLKSGKSYEFSIVSKMKPDGTFLENYTIEEGVGSFSTSKEHFILHRRSNKESLLFYKVEGDMQVDFEISLTPKQNLGEGKTTFIVANFFDQHLFIYNAGFFNICKVI